MAKKTYTQLKETIAALEREAERTRLAELADIVSRIKSAIAAYGITEAELFGGTSTKAGRSIKKPRTGRSKSSIPIAKYSDGKGGEWVGRGPRPRWLRDALAAGASLADFKADGARVTAGSKTKERRAQRTTKAAPVARFTDGAGQSWSGRGPKPRWVRDAVAGGKSLDELRV